MTTDIPPSSEPLSSPAAETDPLVGHTDVGDQWLHWSITIIALVVPILVLLIWYSIPNEALTWHEVYLAFQRGDFLVPVMILTLESIRRWWREVDGGGMIDALRILITILCGLAAFTCLVATVSAASSNGVSPASGRSITAITLASFVISFLTGTPAVSRSRKAGESR
jgi:hypothetical protein